MSGFFGFLDFTKEGPGISKNGPKKKAFFVFWETFLRNFWRFFSINLVYVALSIPVITRGFACVGITNVTRNIARDKHSFGLSDFFETIKKNWKQALSVGLLNILITLLIGFGIWFYNESYIQTQQNLSLAGLIISLLLLAVFSMMTFYIYTLMVTFNFSIKSLYVNSFKFVLLNLWKNLLCGICIVLIYGVYAFFALLFNDVRVWLIELIIMVATLPAFKYLLIQFFTFGSIKKYIIDPYYAQNPDADIEKRRNLGLDVPEDEEPISWE